MFRCLCDPGSNDSMDEAVPPQVVEQGFCTGFSRVFVGCVGFHT